MKKEKLLVIEDFKDIARKGQGIMPELENPGHVIWSKDDAISMAYDVAPTIYRKNRSRWAGTYYTEDDFIQDAAMYISDKYDEGYIDTTSENMQKIIYYLLNSYFVINKEKTVSRKKSELVLDTNVSTHGMGAIGHLDPDENYSDLVLDEELDPEELLILNNAIKDGKDLIDEIISNLSPLPFSTRKYNYTTADELAFSPKTLAEMFLRGMTANEIIAAFGINKDESPSEAITVTRKLKSTVELISDIVNDLDEESRFNIKVYLYNLTKEKPSFPDIAPVNTPANHSVKKV